MALWGQRLAPAQEPVVWDYHVIGLVGGADRVEAWDLDTRLALPTPIETYLRETFRPLAVGYEALAPVFRLVEAGQLLARFATDRSHMRDPSGAWLQPPPDWSPPAARGESMNLPRFVDMADGIAGEVLDLQGLWQRFVGA